MHWRIGGGMGPLYTPPPQTKKKLKLNHNLFDIITCVIIIIIIRDITKFSKSPSQVCSRLHFFFQVENLKKKIPIMGGGTP